MTKYFYLGSLLPELRLGEKPEIGIREYEQLLQENLSDGDYSKISTLRGLYDILNLRFYWNRQPIDPMGNYDEAEIEEALATRSLLPTYVFEFIDKYPSDDERLRQFPELITTFYSIEIRRCSGFLRDYLVMERELCLVLAAFRAKRLNRDIGIDLHHENPEDPIIAQIIAQKEAPGYHPPENYQEIGFIFDTYRDSPIDLQKALFEFRLKRIEDVIGIQLFSINRILAYYAELILIERWWQMDHQKGIEIIDCMLKEI